MYFMKFAIVGSFDAADGERKGGMRNVKSVMLFAMWGMFGLNSSFSRLNKGELSI